MGKKGPTVSTKYSWADFSKLRDLPIADVDLIRQTLRHIKASPTENDLEYFFSTVLRPWYDRTTFGGLARDAAAVVYRLSDMVPELTRKTTIVFVDESDPMYYSLEDWRKVFVLGFKNGANDVPVFTGEPPWMPGMDVK